MTADENKGAVSSLWNSWDRPAGVELALYILSGVMFMGAMLVLSVPPKLVNR